MLCVALVVFIDCFAALPPHGPGMFLYDLYPVSPWRVLTLPLTCSLFPVSCLLLGRELGGWYLGLSL